MILPSKPRVVLEEQDKGVYEIDGLYPGYGHTLGNSLRRILLSSLPGAAVTRAKIEGASHEFSTIPGVREDVVAILLNLKKMRFKMLTDEPQIVKIKTKGAKVVKAEDADLPGQVEIANPDLVIATLTDKSSVFEAELTVEKGLGYVMRDVLQKEKAQVGEMVLDAVFTPMRRVNYEVENMRVGDRTDFNRLRLTIQTDDTITPHDALEEAIRIMINQLKAIVGFQEEEVAETHPDKSEPEETGSADAGDQSEDKNKMRIEDLDLSERIVKALSEASIRTVGGLVRRTSKDLMGLEGIGDKAITELKRAVGKLGLTLKD
ncbi:MAG: DNA-directed RNA polymerase subunit alpha [Candidatus Niyogibacteria bacterium RIFCSPLOWO2_01_FULL_45_48]|uniref:DNA-directed RNA polymerase subunit alpha n=2 Tax=Candidatus Niyogiibacteriota TaxID=1817912 RepID=A0A1G2F1Y9_9BACT|nr:MAG: DNA-directed RNA polymerase subunit alpha [Candidatus Niyogibacteria bacterium RIFCSPHIGHO2_01_FULL_45_28]OGZ29829.1 MAG: DNA-directed RNA polymerase subunit alpha [Candidatus Niyogibacteria bacterium RIFCSPLOWO2_01_FULL_45_48]OGZ31670.1 MAG: DNA-directed RNA polymerase subunit alpha [Candidatus Niyogibacteria bacterium RIFCSPLOWO2_02_FULL_45_13]